MTDPSVPQPQIRARVLVSGIVQGVGYRFATSDRAAELGIAGWVRNLSVGASLCDSTYRRVEAVFEGTEAAVSAMVRWCHQGPRGAVVKDVAVEYEEVEGLRGFEIRR
ncbi:MAG: acylphosphatase [Cyanosarcina radialis HA8281-LM2]|jgi:acylphosphatase|nr:acylphosphatase [Cyanosarcina radialis HA8281-LM2]